MTKVFMARVKGTPKEQSHEKYGESISVPVEPIDRDLELEKLKDGTIWLKAKVGSRDYHVIQKLTRGRPVVIVEHWNADKTSYRLATFCSALTEKVRGTAGGEEKESTAEKIADELLAIFKYVDDNSGGELDDETVSKLAITTFIESHKRH